MNNHRLCEGCARERFTPTSILGSSLTPNDSTPISDYVATPSSDVSDITAEPPVAVSTETPILYDVAAGPSSASGPSPVESGPSSVGPSPVHMVSSTPKPAFNLTEKWKICYVSLSFIISLFYIILHYFTLLYITLNYFILNCYKSII